MTSPVEFITHWHDSAGAELGNSQSFLKELCALLDVPQPEPTRTDGDRNQYVFEKGVAFNNGDGTTSPGRIDLYRKGCFVLESKQGSERKEKEQEEALATVTKQSQKKSRHGTAVRGTPGWDLAMEKARHQARRYAEALPEWPPFLIVVDVGHCFDVYADFSQSGKHYGPFPDPQRFRVRLADLADDEVRERLRALWLDPHSLDPSRRAAKATRELAAQLAKLSRSLESQTGAAGVKVHKPEVVAQFLMRCLFTMFAEDVELIDKDSFKSLLESLRESPETFAPMVEDLWEKMDTGGFSSALRKKVRRFNGGLFEDRTALPLNRDQLELLIEAAGARWADVEPAIFGTLLERALDEHERHKLGAHFTPRAYVERLVIPTVIEPLREEWEDAYATAVSEYEAGDANAARQTVRDFHQKLCETRVLDPACGTGNFLYVSLALMKELEGVVLQKLDSFGEKQLPLLTVDPHQFLGIEVNPRAAAIADLVLWIGYLQWHYRVRGKKHPEEPIIRNFHNIECRDAVLGWDSVEPVVDEHGKPVTRWDGRTTKPHPVTGDDVPDRDALITMCRYVAPRIAEWPKADFIISNPPYLGVRRMRTTVGDQYVDALVNAFAGEVPETADYVMYWWHKASLLVSSNNAKRFGFITTNSIVQDYSRAIVEKHLSSPTGIRLIFAIEDHPWVDNADGAAVNIAMTVGASKSAERCSARIGSIDRRSETAHLEIRSVEAITSSLRSDFDRDVSLILRANRGVCFQGVIPGNDGFKLSPEALEEVNISADALPPVVRRYIIGKDIVQRHKAKWVVDFFRISEEDARLNWPTLFQWILVRVKPERDHNPRPTRRINWWLFAENAPKMRRALNGLKRYIATPNTAKHRPFVFVDGDVLPDAMAYSIASDDAAVLGVLSSRIHVKWALASGGRLGLGNDPRYTSNNTFLPFAFPATPSPQLREVRELGEHLDAHRKRQQALHPDLTMTGMYNVLEKLRSGEPLSAKEKVIHEQGLVSVLKQIHDDLDAAVFDAYGWPHDLTDEQILERLVALNHERAAEEARGIVRWLRPDFQNPAGRPAMQTTLELAPEETDDDSPGPAAAPAAGKAKKEPWPKPLPDRFRAVRAALARHAGPALSEDIAGQFARARKTDVADVLETLVTVGQARRTQDGRYVP